jgi:hypothetical protein
MDKNMQGVMINISRYIFQIFEMDYSFLDEPKKVLLFL